MDIWLSARASGTGYARLRAISDAQPSLGHYAGRLAAGGVVGAGMAGAVEQ
jgi:hypothetical protein